MRNLLALIGTVVVLFVGLGWYFKWYSFAVTPGTNGKQHISVEVDTNKITDDAKKVGTAVQALRNGDGAKGADAPEFVGPPRQEDMPMRIPGSLTTTPQTTIPPPKMPYSISVPGPTR